MNPIYRFVLSIDGENALPALPVYKDDLAIDYEQESGQQFFRGKLNGKLTFNGSDFVRIVAASFDAEFGLEILISYDMGKTWESYWNGQFYKTDCEINEDDKTVIVTPTLKDRYNAVLSGMDKEYNLIDLTPVIQPVKLDKRPMIQVYVPGQTVIGCFLSGMWWEQECESVLETDTIEIEGKTYPALEYKYHFDKNKTARVIEVTQQGTPEIPEIYFGEPYSGTGTTEYTKEGYKFLRNFVSQSGGAAEIFQIVRISDEQIMWSIVFTRQIPKTYPIEIELAPVEGSGATGMIKLYIHDVSVFARYVTDVETALDLNTYPIPDDDIVENNRNYSRVIGYYFPNTIFFNDVLSTTPTKWGIYQPGLYYEMFSSPADEIYKTFPVARSAWGRMSIWFAFDATDWILEQRWRKEYTLKDTFPIWSVISTLLGKIAPGITHEGTAIYSEFLYDVTNPVISYLTQTLFITPKSNIISAEYDQPAQKAPITLKRVTDMLRDCFRCYWFIDEQNRFRIEHISWFMRGEKYHGEPTPGINLTEQLVSRNGKPWSYARNQYKYEKPEMASRYQFGWMDDSTELFDGEPIDIISKYVNPDNIEQISVQQFTSDIDYILLNPSEISKDGFVLLGANRKQLYRGQITVNSQGYADIPVSVNDDWKKSKILVEYEFSSGQGYFYMSGPNTWTIYPPFSPLSNKGQFEIQLIDDITSCGFYLATPGAVVTVKVLGIYELPYVSIVNLEANYRLQNGYVAFVSLQEFYRYDMPAKTYQIGGTEFQARGIKKLRTQEISFPVLREPNMFDLIKTELGNGAIQKMSVNLSSRNAKTTLKYDTE